MNDQPEFSWPPLPEPFAGALREAVSFIRDRFQPIGIIAAGSIVRGTPDPSSDLDLYVIHEQPFRQRLQKFFQGVPAEIFVNPPPMIRRYLAEEREEGRPVTAHMLATGWVVLSRSPVVQELRAEAAEQLENPAPAPGIRLVSERYMAACLYEDALDVAGRDPSTTLMLLDEAVVAMLHFYFRKQGRFLPRIKELLSQLMALDPELGEVARCFFVAPGQERPALAEKIADRTINVHGFFEWESGADAVSMAGGSTNPPALPDSSR